MNVHIPQSGSQELPRRVRHPRAFRHTNLSVVTHLADAISGYYDGHVGTCRPSSRVDDRDMDENEAGGLYAR